MKSKLACLFMATTMAVTPVLTTTTVFANEIPVKTSVMFENLLRSTYGFTKDITSSTNINKSYWVSSSDTLKIEIFKSVTDADDGNVIITIWDVDADRIVAQRVGLPNSTMTLSTPGVDGYLKMYVTTSCSEPVTIVGSATIS